ncbi:MAG: T9SS C-terminal target domain-containing protein [Candidatus Marinimicrobia bacterium]|nr:T9SS C-terminal target domain-containing protein [Candidatus Neomarinimicrobiota bacterium]
MKKLPFIILILLSGSSFAQNHIGSNISSLADWSSEITFVNVFNQAREWISFDNGGAWDSGVPIALSSDGYPLEIPYNDGVNPPQYVRTLMLWDIDGLYPSGNYRLIVSGTGQITLSGAVNGTFSCPVDQVVSVNNSGGIILTINSSALSDPINDIRLIIPGSHNTYQTAPFNPSFLNYISDFETIRFMDFMKTNFSPVVSWSDRSPHDYYTQTLQSGVAYEYLIELCNTTQKNAWVCIPHQADNNFITQFATLLRDSLDPNLNVYVEYTNEAWNGIFSQSQYVEIMGNSLGYAGQPWEQGWKYYAKRSADIHYIFETVFNNENRIVNVVASQTLGYVSDYILSRYEEVAYNPNQVQAEALANAPYFGGGLADVIGNAGLANTITVDDILDSLEYSSLPQAFIEMQDGKLVAQNHNVEYIAYEGGQHLVSYAYTSNLNFVNTLIEVNRNPRMEDLYCQYFNYWYDTIQGGLFCQFTSHYKPGIYGSWGVKEHMNDTLAPKYLGLKNCVFNANAMSMLGDLNQDGTINILDIVRVVAIILDDDPTEYELWAGDVNGDGEIDVLDIVLLIGIILE